MKKYLITASFFGLFLCLGNNAQAQSNADLTIALTDVRTIAISAPSVSIPFTTAAHYQSGTFKDVSSHVTITSTNKYAVKVQAATANLSFGANTIPVNTIGIIPTIASGDAPTLIPVTQLSTSPQDIATSLAAGTLSTVFNIRYTSTGGAEYISKPEGNYTVNLEYTILPQ
ncbi:MAG: hypothetical protein EOP49_08325 [Sphingobacteriales bacterium]|nr:MAG: hypothetical protein EOP49_08325 [Sphingobacteriales bacterium]